MAPSSSILTDQPPQSSRDTQPNRRRTPSNRPTADTLVALALPGWGEHAGVEVSWRYEAVSGP
jgi:hypothetical protein